MSLQSRPIPPIPSLTAKIARRAFRKGNVYMQMRDVLGAFFTCDQLLYPSGRLIVKSLISRNFFLN